MTSPLGDDRLDIIRALLNPDLAYTGKSLEICLFEFPDNAGRIVVERTDHGLWLWVSGFEWPVALLDLYHRRDNTDPDDDQQGTVLLQLCNYLTGDDPLRLTYIDGDHADVCEASGAIVEVLDPKED